MKQKRNIIFLLIFLLISNSLVSIASPSLVSKHWASKHAEELKARNIMKGYPNGDLGLSNDITRAEFITMINRLFSFNSYKKELGFKDLEKNHWAYKNIAIGVENGYIQGYSDNSFKADAYITREEASKIIGSILKYESEYSLKIFKDRDTLSLWSKPYIGGLVDKGILEGMPNGKIEAKKHITRGEVAKILNLSAGSFYEETNLTYNSNLIVKDKASLKNLKVKGDLIVTGERLKELKLDNVTIDGKIIILSKNLDDLDFSSSEASYIQSLRLEDIYVKLSGKSLLRQINKNDKNIKVEEKVEEPSKPEEPGTDPEEPSKPEEPGTDPEEPSKPEEPGTDLEKPSKPEEPEEPSKPTEPEEPSEPKEPEKERVFLNVEKEDLLIDKSGLTVKGETSKNARVTFIIKDEFDDLIYSGQMDKTILDGKFERYFALENQPSGNYTISISAWLGKEKDNKKFNFVFENIKALEDIKNSLRDDFEDNLLEKGEDLLHINFDSFYDLSYKQQDLVINRLYIRVKDISSVDELQDLINSEVDYVLNLKELPKIKKDLKIDRDFKIEDNYTGEDDWISFSEDIVFDSGLKARLVSLDKTKTIELKDTIQISENIFTIPKSSLGDLPAGDYLFILQLEDQEGQVSEWDKAYLIKFILEKDSLFKEAELLVEKAEHNLNRISYNIALEHVNKLEDSLEKENLKKRLDKVDKIIIEKEKLEEELLEAEKLVNTAKANKTRENYNKALEAVKKLQDSKEKDQFLIELNKIDDYLNSLEKDEELTLKIINIYNHPKGARVKVEFVFKDSGERAENNLLSKYHMDITSHDHDNFLSLQNFMDLVIYKEDGFGSYQEMQEKVKNELKVNIYKKDEISQNDRNVKEAIKLIRVLEEEFDQETYLKLKDLLEKIEESEARLGLVKRLEEIEKTMPKEYELYELRLEDISNDIGTGASIVKANIYNKKGEKEEYDSELFAILPISNTVAGIEKTEDQIILTCHLRMDSNWNYEPITKDNFYAYVHGPESDLDYSESIKNLIKDMNNFVHNFWGDNDSLFKSLLENIRKLPETASKDSLLERLKAEANYKYDDYFKENYEDIRQAKILLEKAEASLDLLDYQEALDFIKSKDLLEDYQEELEKIKEKIDSKASGKYIKLKDFSVFKKKENMTYLWIGVDEIAESSINKDLKFEGKVISTNSDIVKLKGIDGSGINMNGKLELAPNKVGKTDIKVLVSDSEGNSLEVTIPIEITKAQPKLLKEGLREGLDYFVDYKEDKDSYPEYITINKDIFPEEGLEVRLYRWHDKNNDGNLFPEKEELLKDNYIVLGKTTRDKEGNIVLEKAKIEDYDPKYKYILTVYDREPEEEVDRLSRTSPDFEIKFDRRGFAQKLLEINLFIKAYKENPSEEALENIIIKVNALKESEQKRLLEKEIEILKKVKISNTVKLDRALFMNYNDLFKFEASTSDKTKIDEYEYDFSKFIIEKDGERFSLEGDYTIYQSFPPPYTSYKLSRRDISLKGPEKIVSKMKSYFPANTSGIKLILKEGWCLNSQGISAEEMEIKLEMDR